MKHTWDAYWVCPTPLRIIKKLYTTLRSPTFYIIVHHDKIHTGTPKGGYRGDGVRGRRSRLPLGKFQVAIGFLRKSGADLPREAIGLKKHFFILIRIRWHHPCVYFIPFNSYKNIVSVTTSSLCSIHAWADPEGETGGSGPPSWKITKI